MFEGFASSKFMRTIRRLALDFDSWVDSSLYASGQRSRERYANFSSFMDRFHVSGPAKLGVELGCEVLTLGLGGSLLMLALATTNDVPTLRRIFAEY